jgi:hypothetical protein
MSVLLGRCVYDLYCFLLFHTTSLVLRNQIWNFESGYPVSFDVR